jgi:hypothetical protein
LPGSPAASRRSISTRFMCWHVLHFLAILLTQRYATISLKIDHHAHLRADKTRYSHTIPKP